jgi:hypothetical protein
MMSNKMMESHRHTLLEARRAYSWCASKVENKIKTNTLDNSLSEKIVGLGVGTEWLRRATEMNEIQYIGKNLNKSRKNDSFVELLRFSFSWFSLNAIFTRPELRSLIGKPDGMGEYNEFRVLYDNAVLTSAQSRLLQLQTLLKTPTSPRMPGKLKGEVVSTLAVISLRYLPQKSPGKTAKAIKNAANSGDFSELDMPTLLYAFRNWSVHGNALDGCFGSRPGFIQYTRLLQETLAEIHLQTSKDLYELL